MMEENNNNTSMEVMEAADSPVESPVDSPRKKNLKIIVPIAVIVVLLAALAGIAALAGLFGNKKMLLINAVANVFAESADAVGEVWGMDEYSGMFADGQLSVKGDFSVGDGVEISMDISRKENVSGAAIDVGYYGSSLFQADLYADEEEILIGAPELTDTVFYVDRTNLEEDIEWFVREYNLDSDIADVLKSYNEESREDAGTNEELRRAMGRLAGAFAEMCDEIKIEKADSKNLRVNGESRKCKGYMMTVDAGQMQGLLEEVKGTYEENEMFAFYLDRMLANSYGYDSQEEFRADYDTCEILSGMEELILEEQKQMEITFYVYRKNLAYLLVDLGDALNMEWNVYGGNFPLENMEFTLTNGYETSMYSRKGSLTNGIYTAEYQTDYSGAGVEISLEYDTEKGDFSLEMGADYGYYALVWLLEGEIDKTVPGSELAISIDTFEMNDRELLTGDITLSDKAGEIVKPAGEKRNIMRMTQSDWYAVLMEIFGNLY